ncbi:transposase InsO family protein [Sphingobium sp. OAS761]|nr:transposase InsO family protein [Sphingobium sp. OAS761]
MLGQHRSTQRKLPRGADDEQALTEDIIALAKQYGRYGYRRVTALLCHAGWTVNHKRVERIWRREGLKVPLRQPKRGRLWLNGSLRDELLNGEIFYSLVEAKVLIEAWRRHYNTVRPHSSLGYRPAHDAPEDHRPIQTVEAGRMGRRDQHARDPAADPSRSQ